MRRDLTSGRLVWRASPRGDMLPGVGRPLMTDLPTEVELRKERADALKLAGRLLEEAVGAWRAADEAITGTSGAARDRALATRDERQKDLERRLWTLVVQREAMGLRHHEDVWLVYGIPRTVQPQPHLGARGPS